MVPPSFSFTNLQQYPLPVCAQRQYLHPAPATHGDNSDGERGREAKEQRALINGSKNITSALSDTTVLAEGFGYWVVSCTSKGGWDLMMTSSPSAHPRIWRQDSLSWCQRCGWEPFCWLGSGDSSAWEWVLPGWISRYLPGSNWQSGYPKCLAEIPPGYKSLLVKCLTSSFQQGAVQLFPDSWDTVSHTYVKITQWHFSATLFTRWYKYKNISSHLTPWYFFSLHWTLKETGEGVERQNMPHMSWHVDRNHVFHVSLHCFMNMKQHGLVYFMFVPDTWLQQQQC